MSPDLLNSRQRAVMRFFFDNDAPPQAVTARGIEECKNLGLVRIDREGAMYTTDTGEAMRDYFTPKKIDWKAFHKAQREARKARRNQKRTRQ